MKDQKSTSQDHYLALYRGWKSSWLSVGLFCEQASVKNATFHYWVKKLNSPQLLTQVLLELRMNQISLEPIVVLSLSAGASVSFYQFVDTRWLETLFSQARLAFFIFFVSLLFVSASRRYALWPRRSHLLVGGAGAKPFEAWPAIGRHLYFNRKTWQSNPSFAMGPVGYALYNMRLEVGLLSVLKVKRHWCNPGRWCWFYKE